MFTLTFFCLFVFLWCYQLLMQLFLNKINFVLSTNYLKQTLREFRECLANTSFTVFIQSMCSGIRRFVCHRWDS